MLVEGHTAVPCRPRHEPGGEAIYPRFGECGSVSSACWQIYAFLRTRIIVGVFMGGNPCPTQEGVVVFLWVPVAG